MAKTRTMYMHTLDGRPARTAWVDRGHAIVHVARGVAAPLVRSLDVLRREQNDAVDHAMTRAREVNSHPAVYRAQAQAFADRLGYVLVRVEVTP